MALTLQTMKPNEHRSETSLYRVSTDCIQLRMTSTGATNSSEWTVASILREEEINRPQDLSDLSVTVPKFNEDEKSFWTKEIDNIKMASLSKKFKLFENGRESQFCHSYVCSQCYWMRSIYLCFLFSIWYLLFCNFAVFLLLQTDIFSCLVQEKNRAMLPSTDVVENGCLCNNTCHWSPLRS